jgi:hypothetical protein
MMEVGFLYLTFNTWYLHAPILNHWLPKQLPSAERKYYLLVENSHLKHSGPDELTTEFYRARSTSDVDFCVVLSFPVVY